MLCVLSIIIESLEIHAYSWLKRVLDIDRIRSTSLLFFSPLSQFTELARYVGVSVIIIKSLVEQTASCLATFPHPVYVPTGTPHPTLTPQDARTHRTAYGERRTL